MLALVHDCPIDVASASTLATPRGPEMGRRKLYPQPPLRRCEVKSFATVARQLARCSHTVNVGSSIDSRAWFNNRYNTNDQNFQ